MRSANTFLLYRFRTFQLLASVMLLVVGGLVRPLHAGVITNDAFFKDTANNPIYSQGGGIFKFGEKYYWYGVRYNGAATYYNNPAGARSATRPLFPLLATRRPI